jgi:hypothetical protein
MMTSLIHARDPSFIEQIEDAVIEAIRAGVSSTVKVESFPADPESYNFNSPAAILVHYSGARFGNAKGISAAQPRDMEFAVVLLARSLKGQGGAYHHLEDIRQALQGQTFAGVGPAFIARQALDAEKNGVWRFVTSIKLAAVAVNRKYQQPAALMRPSISE